MTLLQLVKLEIILYTYPMIFDMSLYMQEDIRKFLQYACYDYIIQ